MCGVLTLESGTGAGNYQHSTPVLHGIWPETGAYGTSKCLAPKDPSEPTKVNSCYLATSPSDAASALGFQKHEWDKHGVCAGVKSADDFATQACTLATPPLAIMKTTKDANGDLTSMVAALKKAGYPIFDPSAGDGQLEVPVCAGSDGQWKIHAVADFPKYCSSSSPPAPGPAPTPPAPTPPAPAPAPSNGTCMASVKGPKCSSDSDCKSLTNCLRCAKSGYCTDVPLLITV